MPVECLICNKIFSQDCSVNRHIRDVHEKEVASKEVHNCKCLEDGCDISFRRIEELISHLDNVHNKKVTRIVEHAKDMNDFHLWKTSIQIDCSYIFKGKKSSTTGEDTSYYYCNRSKRGDSCRRTDKQYKRKLKSQGSCKLQSYCTSYIKVTRNEDGTLTINWVKTHYGHDPQLQHIRLQNSDRQNIAIKLLSGISPEKILDTTRDNLEEHLKRLDLLTARDIYNISKSFNIDIGDKKRNDNDAISVDPWVEECNSKDPEENPVLFYKRQGDLAHGFDVDDFCLVIMNKNQTKMLQTFGSNIVAIDGSHDLNGYDFELTTLIVIDEYNQGFPVAFMFSNRKHTCTCDIFFQQIKNKIGVLTPKIVMSDLAETCYNAWILVMGAPVHHLFCSWHVDSAWQSNLNKILDLDKRSDIHKVLKDLQQETNKYNFELVLNKSLVNMLEDEETRDFGNYFKQFYYHNYEQWAYCFREECEIKSNMHLESMYKVIRYFYVGSKTVKRLDKGLHAVLKYVRDKSVERIIKIVEGQNTISRHNEAVNSIFHLIDCGTYWTLWKNTDDGVSYIVKKLQNEKCCEVVCSSCNICIHMYSCNCPDSLNKNKVIICIHTHYVVHHGHTVNRTHENHCDSNSENVILINNDACKSNDKLKSVVSSTFLKLQQINLEELEDSVLQQIHHHLNVINSLTNQIVHKPNCFVTDKNDNHVITKYLQPHIQLRKTSNKRPSIQQANSIRKVLINDAHQLFISDSVFNDHNYSKYLIKSETHSE